MPTWKLPSGSVVCEAAFTGIIAGGSVLDTNCALNVTGADGIGWRVTALSNFPEMLSVPAGVTVGHGEAVKTDISEGCLKTKIVFPDLIDPTAVLFVIEDVIVEFDMSCAYIRAGIIANIMPIVINPNRDNRCLLLYI